MTNEKIWGKAIDKAVENGYQYIQGYNYVYGSVPFLFEEVIFSHEFAKAFWSFVSDACEVCLITNCNKDNCEIFGNLEPWQYHLQQMVLEPEPLKYLEKFLV